MAAPTFREDIAKRKLGVGDDFHWYRWEAVGTDAVLMDGCVVTSFYTKGPRKGRPKYDGPKQSVVVTDGEVKQAALDYEKASGNCANCMGDGKEYAGFDHTGTKWRECGRCKGTGKIAA